MSFIWTWLGWAPEEETAVEKPELVLLTRESLSGVHLRHTETNQPITDYPPRHPVLAELLRVTARVN
jgi:hypothetical protein